MHIVNVTPHAITFQRIGEEPFTVEPCGVVISATPVEHAAVNGWRHVEGQQGETVSGETSAKPCEKCKATPSLVVRVHYGGPDDDCIDYTCEACLRADGWLPPLAGVELVYTRFERAPQSERALEELITANPDAVIVGSIIAAQAFPGRVFAMTPTPGFERVPTEQKRMNPDKFVTF